jgi:hypothetical protein
MQEITQQYKKGTILQKLLFGILALLISTIFLASCEVGKQPTINAYASNGCFESNCQITVAYNTNGLAINQIVPNYNPTPGTSSYFYCTTYFSSNPNCGNIINNQSGSCVYSCITSSGYQSSNTNISFSLGGVTSNIITVTSP